MTELRVNNLIDEADELLDSKLRVGGYCLFINTDDLQDILSKIRAILPEEIKTAEMILKRRDDIYMEAQSRADRIISEAQNTAANILSESELIRAVREKAAKIQEQVKESCEEMKNKATEESDALRRNTYKEAMEIKDGAKAYAEKLLSEVERDIDNAHRQLKQCLEYVAQQKKQDSAREAHRNYNNKTTVEQ